jgi:uncharacterized radical SAM superfamily Fe-S cluster-containing enzyme
MFNSGTACCPISGEVLFGSLRFGDGVRLARYSQAHGQFENLIYASEEYFDACVRSASQEMNRSEKCLVVEITDRCDVGCATCSACSVDDGKDEPGLALVAGVRSAVQACGANVVALSGGEPLMRDDIWIIADLIKAFTDRVVLITSGRGFETDQSILQEISERSEWLEVYLQFDSLNLETLRSMRTPSTTPSLRKNRLRLAVQTGAIVSAVCVVSDFTQDDEIKQLTEYLIANGAGGVTFQPLRELGRFPIKQSERDHLRTVDGIQRAALSTVFESNNPVPFSGQPFDMSVSWLNGTSASEFFVARSPRQDFRIATSSYWDFSNYFSPLTEGNPAYFFMRERGNQVRMLNRHYFDMNISEFSRVNYFKTIA